jgi:hypothetical protein
MPYTPNTCLSQIRLGKREWSRGRGRSGSVGKGDEEVVEDLIMCEEIEVGSECHLFVTWCHFIQLFF